MKIKIEFTTLFKRWHFVFMCTPIQERKEVSQGLPGQPCKDHVGPTTGEHNCSYQHCQWLCASRTIMATTRTQNLPSLNPVLPPHHLAIGVHHMMASTEKRSLPRSGRESSKKKKKNYQSKLYPVPFPRGLQPWAGVGCNVGFMVKGGLIPEVVGKDWMFTHKPLWKYDLGKLMWIALSCTWILFHQWMPLLRGFHNWFPLFVLAEGPQARPNPAHWGWTGMRRTSQ